LEAELAKIDQPMQYSDILQKSLWQSGKWKLVVFKWQPIVTLGQTFVRKLPNTVC